MSEYISKPKSLRGGGGGGGGVGRGERSGCKS